MGFTTEHEPSSARPPLSCVGSVVFVVAIKVPDDNLVGSNSKAVSNPNESDVNGGYPTISKCRGAALSLETSGRRRR